jgi:hypothetical protein
MKMKMKIWINDTKMKEMHKIQVELNESKEKVSKLQKDNEEHKKISYKERMSSPRCNPLMNHSLRRLRT